MLLLHCERGLAFYVAGGGFLILSLWSAKQTILQRSWLVKLAGVSHCNAEVMEVKRLIPKKRCPKCFNSMVFRSQRAYAEN